MALLGLALVLWAGLHAGEGQPQASAVHLSLLQRLGGERAPERTSYFLVSQACALETLGWLPPRLPAQCPDSGFLFIAPQREAKDAIDLQCCLVKIFSWGTLHLRPILIALAGLFKSQSLEGLRRGPTSVSQPQPPLAQSPREALVGWIWTGQGLLPAVTSCSFGAGLARFLPAHLSWEPSAPAPPQPFPTKDLAGACGQSLAPLPPFGTQAVWASGPGALLLAPGAEYSWATRSTSKGEDGE